MVIGGFDAFQTILELTEERKNYPEFCIPMCVLPATISNNVPGTGIFIYFLREINFMVKMTNIFFFVKTISRNDFF